MAMFGSSWDEEDYDDGPIGISSSMKEDIRAEQNTKQSPSSEAEQRPYKAKVEISKFSVTTK